MGFIIFLVIAYLAFLNFQSSNSGGSSDSNSHSETERYSSQNTNQNTNRNSYQNTNRNSYQNTNRNSNQNTNWNTSQNSTNQGYRLDDDLIIPYNRLIYPESTWEFSGDTILIKDEVGDGYFILIKEGLHQMRDADFVIQYTIESHYNSSGQKKMYYNHIDINNIPVEGKVTNKRTAASVLNDIENITKGAAFNDDAIGRKFFVDCAAVLLFNEINSNRSLTDYIDMPKARFNTFIINASGSLHIYMREIEALFYEKSSNNTSNSSHQNFEIYLKVLEFDSVHNVKFDDIKVQYKKLAKKYHPDSISGDATRFKLITDSYKYLQENYPN